MAKNNHYTYNVGNGSVSGFFNVYQAKNGYIFIQMGNGYTKLTETQVKDLGINLYILKDFDHNKYIQAYK